MKLKITWYTETYLRSKNDKLKIFCAFNDCAVLWCAQIIEYIMAWWSYTVICTIHYLIIIIMQTCLKLLNCLNASKIYPVSRMCLRLGKFSQLSLMQYIGLCGLSLPISLMMIVRIHVLDLIIIIESEVWPIWHCLGLGHEKMVCAVCLYIFFWYILNTHIYICIYIYKYSHITPHLITPYSQTIS